jgi:hypothetical protein
LPVFFHFGQDKKFKSSRNYFARRILIEKDFKELLMTFSGH